MPSALKKALSGCLTRVVRHLVKLKLVPKMTRDALEISRETDRENRYVAGVAGKRKVGPSKRQLGAENDEEHHRNQEHKKYLGHECSVA